MKAGVKKFLTICAVVVCAGLVLSVIGYFTGGIDAMSGLSDKYSWIKGPAGDREYTYLKEGESFTSIKVVGDIDVNISESSSGSRAELGYGQNNPKPEMYVENDTLVVKAEMDRGNIYLNFGGKNDFPVLNVYCEKDVKLEKVEADLSYGDVGVEYISCDSLYINTDYGDVNLYYTQFSDGKILCSYGDVSGESIASGGLNAVLEMGDCGLSGRFTGELAVNVDAGDTDIDTVLAEAEYKITVDVEAGDLTVGNNEFDSFSNHYAQGEGPNSIDVVSEMGDVEIAFR